MLPGQPPTFRQPYGVPSSRASSNPPFTSCGNAAGSGCGVRVGAGTIIREHATINRSIHEGKETTLGEKCFLMAASHVAHDCELGNHVILANNATLAGHVEIDDRASIGAYSGVHQFCRIGLEAFVGGWDDVLAIDTGCVWGRELSALRLEDRLLYRCECGSLRGTASGG